MTLIQNAIAIEKAKSGGTGQKKTLAAVPFSFFQFKIDDIRNYVDLSDVTNTTENLPIFLISLRTGVTKPHITL